MEAHMRCSIDKMLWKDLGRNQIRVINTVNSRCLTIQASPHRPDIAAKKVMSHNLKLEDVKGEGKFSNPEMVEMLLDRLDLVREVGKYYEI